MSSDPCIFIVGLYCSRCVSNQRPLIDSGTMGPKGHVQVIVPHVTESYTSQVRAIFMLSRDFSYNILLVYHIILKTP